MPLQAEVNYPEILIGQPKPIEVVENASREKISIEIHGTPVSKGYAKGRARVARTLDEAKETQVQKRNCISQLNFFVVYMFLVIAWRNSCCTCY